MTSAKDIITRHEDECKRSIQHFRKELQKVRTGRASSGLVEGIHVEYYGSKVPLSQLCQINTPEPRLIALQVYDAQAVGAIEKAIHTAGLGLTPSRDKNTIRLLIPPLTEESRKELIKHLHKMAEEIRVAVRTHRREANEHLKKTEKEDTLPKDEVKRTMDQVQKITDLYIQEVDKVLSVKEKECLEV